jgi:hypothetical protein
MSSKKTLLSKLKKDLAKSKAKVSIDVSGTVSVTDRRNSFLKEIKIMRSENKTLQDIQDRIRVHISFYNDDKDFSKFLDLDEKHIDIFLETYDDKTNVMTQIDVFYRNIFSKTQKSEVDMLKDRLRSITFPTDKIVLYSLEPFVFDAVQFTPDYNIILFPGLVYHLLHNMNLTTLVEMRKEVCKYMFDHRFDYVIQFLENDAYPDKEKQFMVTETLQSGYENLRGIQLYLQVMNLIDEKITPFQKPLQSLLLRFLPDKEYYLSVKNFLDIILEIVINKPSDKQLAKYFPNKKKLDYFRSHFLPELQTEKGYSRVIRNRIRQEFDQPFVFKNADRVRWQTYLEIIRKHQAHATSSMEVDIYDALRQSDTSLLDQLILFLSDENINKSQIHIMLTKYISLQPVKKQKHLEKLKNLTSFSKLKTILIEIKENGYLEIIESLSNTMIQKTPITKTPELINLEKTQSLYKYRFDIHNFDHITIEPIDNVSIYILEQEKSSDRFFIPNDLFYTHLADNKIVKTQIGQVFTMNKLKMKVVYVSITNDYTYQDEQSYANGLVFVNTQKGLDTAANPLSFYNHFVSCPILNHQSSLMMTTRQKNISRLSAVFLKDLPSVNPEETPRNIEDSIYQFSESLDEYTTSISILITLIQSSFAKTTRDLLTHRSINITKIGQLLKEPMETIFMVLYPEIFAVNDEKSLRIFFKTTQNELKKRIILDIYFTQNPMRRIPYMPVSRYVGGDLDKLEITKSIPETPNDLTEKYLQESTGIEMVSILSSQTMVMENEVIVDTLDPLANFIDDAFDELDNL